MEEKNPRFAVIGALIGAVLLYLVIQAAVDYLAAGVARIDAEEAAAARLESSFQAESAAPAEGAATTETVAPVSEAPAAVSETMTPTATLTDTVPPATEAAPAEASEEIVAAINKGTCNACHVIPGVPGAVGIVGPNLSNIGTAAAERKPGMSARDYLVESIMDPNAFIAPECPFGACVPGAMPATLATTLSQDEIDLIIDYLLTLHGAN